MDSLLLLGPKLESTAALSGPLRAVGALESTLSRVADLADLVDPDELLRLVGALDSVASLRGSLVAVGELAEPMRDLHGSLQAVRQLATPIRLAGALLAWFVVTAAATWVGVVMGSRRSTAER